MYSLLVKKYVFINTFTNKENILKTIIKDTNSYNTFRKLFRKSGNCVLNVLSFII